MSHRRPVLAVVAATLVLFGGGCSSSSGGGGATGPTTTTAPADASSTSTTTSGSSEPLHILVSNDDGYNAEGIDVLVEALREVDGVDVTVVAPLDQRSGTGGKTTDGALAVTDVKTLSGYPAKAVDGFPADAIRVAIDDQGEQPDLVVTGINAGQNLGPLVDVSGTVGAARAAVARGVPALATSQGIGEPFDYAAAVPLILDWLSTHRAALAAGEEPVAVTSLNVPSCSAGEVRGLAEVEPDVKGDTRLALAAQDCASSAPLDAAAGDIAAFATGYATLSTLGASPAN